MRLGGTPGGTTVPGACVRCAERAGLEGEMGRDGEGGLWMAWAGGGKEVRFTAGRCYRIWTGTPFWAGPSHHDCIMMSGINFPTS